MEFLLLGPLEVRDEGRELPLGGLRQQAVLAHLVLSAGVPLPAEQLVERVWADRAPPHARGSLHTYVSRLRRLLGPDRVQTRGSAYLLHCRPDEVDVRRFEHLLATAAALTAQDPRAAVDACDRALALWRSTALGELADESSLRATADRLEALHETAVCRRLDARLLCGEHADVLVELADLLAERPLREDLWARYVLALYRSGRAAEAVTAGDRARRLLDRELGVEPGRALQVLQERVLRQDPGLLLHAAELHGYRLGDVLGRGRSAVVHRALQPWLGRPVALKSLHPAVADDPRIVHGFAAAAHAAANVDHPHVLTLYDAWREPGQAVLVLRLAVGGTLADAVHRCPPGPVDLLRLAVRLASALDACCQEGVVHADLDPRDVLLDQAGSPLVSPFVLTRDLARSQEPLTGRPDVAALADLLTALSRAWATRPLRTLLEAASHDDPGTGDAHSLAVRVARALRPSAVPTPRRPLVRGPGSRRR